MKLPELSFLFQYLVYIAAFCFAIPIIFLIILEIHPKKKENFNVLNGSYKKFNRFFIVYLFITELHFLYYLNILNNNIIELIIKVIHFVFTIVLIILLFRTRNINKR